MLNYIWLALIVIGVGVAAWSDARDISSNRYHNGRQVTATLTYGSLSSASKGTFTWPCTISISPAALATAYGEFIGDSIKMRAEFVIEGRGGKPPRILPSGAPLHIFFDAQSPDIPNVWRDIYSAQGQGDYLSAFVHFRKITLPPDDEHPSPDVTIEFDPVRFVKLNAVTNDGVIKYAKTAVELAIGLIGIMALWLGIMKIAEQSGLVSKLAALLKPLTTRLFPDVPPDHPAMGAMIMNISANMLGLANAATPLGLKAMEELNKLNRKAGTATDAMCTFLVINTSNVQLIPATVIAIRAAAGSANPTDILGPVIVATAVSLIAGVTTVRLLAKLPVFKRQLEGGAN